MIQTATQLKALIRNKSKGNSATAQTLIRSYFMERFLERVSLSEYKNSFVLKGGLLISSIVGLDTRSTMDIDGSIKNMPLTLETVKDMVEKIIAMPLEDNTSFSIKKIEPIMEEADYGGIRISLDAQVDNMQTPLKIDISTGDVITPRETAYHFKLMFEERSIPILAYNLETLLSEKLETVIRRGELNTRLRDFYDIAILVNGIRPIQQDTFRQAFKATTENRGTVPLLENGELILQEVRTSATMQSLWQNYQRKFTHAKDFTWETVMDSVDKLYIMAME